MAGCSQHVMGCSSICPAVLLPLPGLPGCVCSQSPPGAAAAHDAAPALGLPQPCPLVPFLFVPWVHFLGASLLVSFLSLTWSGKVCPGQGPCPVLWAPAPEPPSCSTSEPEARTEAVSVPCLPCHAREQPVPT